jgi:ADP-L-glycero-D-manno-heptose 6-epimerase
MNKNIKIACTGGAGFIASNVIKRLNKEGYTNIDVYEKLDTLHSKMHNILSCNIKGIYDYKELLISNKVDDYDHIIHFGASSSTTTKPEDYEKVLYQNFYYTKDLLRMWAYFSQHHGKRNSKFIFASSASVYGNSSDFTERTEGLRPPHLYGKTKQLCDIEIEQYLNQYFGNHKCYSFRFFNCFGADESHKVERRMASPITRFLSDKPPFALFRDDKNTVFERDFIWVNDLADVIYFTLTNDCKAGIYNLGSGEGTSWEKLASICADVRGLPKDNLFKYEPLPENLQKQYQSRTVADLTKLRNQLGYKKEFTSLEDAIKETYKDIKNR